MNLLILFQAGNIWVVRLFLEQSSVFQLLWTWVHFIVLRIQFWDHIFCKTNLFKWIFFTLCVPCLTYCADVKELTSGDMHKFNVALNDSIRLIYSYNRWESTRFLLKELKFPNIVEIFHSRKKSFVENVRGMNNAVVRFLVRRSFKKGWTFVV